MPEKEPVANLCASFVQIRGYRLCREDFVTDLFTLLDLSLFVQPAVALVQLDRYWGVRLQLYSFEKLMEHIRPQARNTPTNRLILRKHVLLFKKICCIH